MIALLAAGVPAAGWALGLLLLPRVASVRMRADPFARHVIAVVFGCALLTPLLVACAAFGAFHVPLLGTAGWIVVAFALLRARVLRSGVRRHGRAPAWLALAAAVIFAVTASRGADETVASARDQQLYLVFAATLADTGSTKLRLPPVDAADRALLGHTQYLHFPGTVPGRNGIDDPFESYFPLGWTVWLALAYAAGGLAVAQSANAVVVAVAGLALFVLARTLYGSAIALAATIAFYLLPSSLYIAGITLSEPLAAAFLLVVPVLALGGLRRAALPMAIVLFAAALVRIDAMVAAPLAATAIVLATGRRTTLRQRTLRRAALLAIAIAFAGTIAVYALLHREYLAGNASSVLMLAAATGAAVLVGVLAPVRALGRLRLVADAPPVRVAAAIVLGVLFVYGATLRPLLEPFSLIANGSGLDGTRDWREASLVNLAAYLSWPVLLTAGAGACGALLGGWLAGRGLVRSLIVLLALGPALLYLWFPHVSPDHPWAVRRFVPLVIPGALLLAALAVRVLAGRGTLAAAALAATMLVAPVTWTLAHQDPAIVFARDQDGIDATLGDIARALPDALVVHASQEPGIGLALLATKGKRVVSLYDASLTGDPVGETVERWVRDKHALGREAWILHGDELPRTGLVATTVRTWSWSFPVVQPTPAAPARALGRERGKLVLSRVEGFDARLAARMFGGEPVWGAQEEGFHQAEVTPFGTFRYTNGAATIVVPASGFHDASGLKADLFSFAPPGRQRAVRILVDDTAVWQGEVGPGITSLRLRLPPLGSETATIAIHSEVVPASEAGSPDKRALGIGLVGLRALRAADEAPPGPGVTDFRSALALAGPAPDLVLAPDGVGEVILDVTNAGRAAWPTIEQQGGPVGAVRMALRWHRAGEADRWVGDNRADLAVSLLPGDRTRLRVPLVPTGSDGQRLPPGRYVVRIGMAREGVALFADNGDAVLEVPVRVEAP